MKNILVLIHDDTGQEARLLAAMDVDRRLNETLRGPRLPNCFVFINRPRGGVPIGADGNPGMGPVFVANS